MNEFNIRPISRADLQSTGDCEPVILGMDPTEPVKAALSKDVVGQEEAVEAVAEFIIQAKARGSRRTDNVDSFLFFGPTGVGKTELVKAAAKHLGWPLISVRGTELKNASSVNRLKGSDPTMVGYGDPPLITPSKLKDPAVVLVDEGEKMHRDVREWWMEVMEEGEATIYAPTGRPTKSGSNCEAIEPTKLDFRGSAVFFTSNEGAGQMADAYRSAARVPMGFPGIHTAENPGKNLRKVALEALETGTFREQPEFLGRIGTKVVFDFLQPEHYSAILDKFISQQLEKLASTGLPVMVQPTVELRELALKQASVGPYGARDLRTFVRNVFREVSKYRLAGSITPNYMYYADMTDEGTLTLHRIRKITQPAVLLLDGSISQRSIKPEAAPERKWTAPLALPAPSSPLPLSASVQ